MLDDEGALDVTLPLMARLVRSCIDDEERLVVGAGGFGGTPFPTLPPPRVSLSGPDLTSMELFVVWGRGGLLHPVVDVCAPQFAVDGKLGTSCGEPLKSIVSGADTKHRKYDGVILVIRFWLMCNVHQQFGFVVIS